MSMRLLKACFGARDLPGADAGHPFDVRAHPAVARANDPDAVKSPPLQHAVSASCNTSPSNHSHQACSSSSLGAAPPPAPTRGPEDDFTTSPHSLAVPSISMVPAPAPRLRPSPHPGLNAYATQHSPCVITALTMDGSRVFQNPMSIRYFGDISKRDWPPQAADAVPQSGLPMGLLRSLFSLEGEQQLQEMLAGLPRQRPAAGDADADTEPFSWCRVMQVPLDCRPPGPGRSPSARRTLCSIPSAGARREVAAAPPSPPVTPGHVPRVDSIDGFLDTQCNAGSPPAAFSFAEVGKQPEAETEFQAVNGSVEPDASSQGCDPTAVPHNHRPSLARVERQTTYSSSNSLMSSSNAVEGAASAMSVAVRNAPPRMLSLLTLSMASKSCPVPTTETDALTPLAHVTPEPGSLHSLSQGQDCAGRQPPRSPTPRKKRLAQACVSCSQLQLEIGSSSPSALSAVARPLTPTTSLRWPAGAPPPPGSSGHGSGQSDAGSASGAVEKSGELFSMLLGGVSPEDLQLQQLAQAGGVERVASKHRLHEVRRAQTQGSTDDEAEDGGRRSGGSGGSGHDEGRMETEPELEPRPCICLDSCWHEVFVTSTWEEDGSQVLLIYQTNVTVRTHLETILAEIADMQLETLCQIFPRHVIESMAKRPPAYPLHTPDLGHLARSHNDVSILFMDIVGFTSMSKQVSPYLVMTFLNSLFSIFDNLCSVHEVFKVETAGDCYIVSSGLMSLDAEGFNQVKQSHDPEDSATRVLAFAMDMLAASRKVLMPHDGSPVSIRIGVHTGPCVSGIVGNKMPKFCVFGDTMNTASRMESTCTPGRIQISSSTHALLVSGGADHAEWEGTGGIAVKGKGIMETFLWVEPQQGLGSLPQVPAIGDDLVAAAMARSSLIQEGVQCSLSALVPFTPAEIRPVRNEGDAAAAAAGSGQRGAFALVRSAKTYGAGQPIQPDASRPQSSACAGPAASPRRPPLRQKSLGFSLQAVGQLMSLMHQTSKLEATPSSGVADMSDAGYRRRSLSLVDGSVVLPSPYVSILEAFRTCEHVDPLKVRRSQVFSDLRLKAVNEQEGG